MEAQRSKVLIASIRGPFPKDCRVAAREEVLLDYRNDPEFGNKLYLGGPVITRDVGLRGTDAWYLIDDRGKFSYSSMLKPRDERPNELAHVISGSEAVVISAGNYNPGNVTVNAKSWRLGDICSVALVRVDNPEAAEDIFSFVNSTILAPQRRERQAREAKITLRGLVGKVLRIDDGKGRTCSNCRKGAHHPEAIYCSACGTNLDAPERLRKNGIPTVQPETQ